MKSHFTKSWLTWSAPALWMSVVLQRSRCNPVVASLDWSNVLSTGTAFKGAQHVLRGMTDGRGQLLIAQGFIQSLLTLGERSLLTVQPSLPIDTDTASCVASQLLIFN